MGKVLFPLVNLRKDVTNEWHLKHITSESVTVPSSPNEWGYYTVYLSEIPDNGTNTNITTSAPKIVGLTEYRGEPINSKTKRINFSQNQFFVNYQTGEILFHQAQAGQTFSVNYFAKGSLVEADDINNLHYRITALENAQIQPVLKNFQLVNMTNTLEIGQKFPVGTELVVPTTFSWELLRPEFMVDESIYITMGNRKIASGLSTSIRETTIDLNQTQTFQEPGILEFSIYGTSISDELISSSFDISWTDRVFFGTTEDKIVSRAKLNYLNSQLLTSTDSLQEIILNIPENENQYKVIALPQRYSINYVIDKQTGFKFVFDDPIEFSFVNDYNITIPYYVYFSTYKITPEVELKMEIGK